MEKSSVFIDKLIQKLKSGDARSIHLDALPGRFARLDVFDLINVEASLHLEFLRKLLSGQPFTFNIQVNPNKYKDRTTDEYKTSQAIVKRLNSLYYREQDEFAEYGTLSFGFGYPLLIKRDPSNPARILKAPLFIWYLQLDRHPQKSNTWTIKRTEEHPILFNEVLKSHLEGGTGLRWNTPGSFDEDHPLDEKLLQQICGDLMAGLGVNDASAASPLTLMPCTNKQAIEHLTKNEPWIRWSGVFGLYKTQKQPIIKDLQDLSQQTAPEATTTPTVDSDAEILTPVLLDPSQETVLHDLNEHGKVVIQGPPGTGKSQSISAIVTSALLNGRKMLIVCEKRTALEVIKDNLEELGLVELTALIEDVYADRNAIVQRIRNQIEEAKQEVPYFRVHAYDFVKDKVLQNRSLLNKRVDALSGRIFGDDSWVELAGQHLQVRQKLEEQKLLQVRLSSSESLSFEHWRTSLAKVDHLSEKMNAVQPYLAAMHLLSTDYWLNTAGNWSQQVKEAAETALRLQWQLETGEKNFGAAFFNLSNSARIISSIAGIFSGRQKALNEARAEAKGLFQTLYQQLEDIRWPDHELTPVALQESSMRWPGIIGNTLLKLKPVADIAQGSLQIRDWLLEQNKESSAWQQVWEQLADKPASERKQYLSEWYFRSFLETHAAGSGMDTDAEKALFELINSDTEIKPLLGERILSLWRQKAKRILQSEDLTQKRMLYNLRKNKQFASKTTLRTILHQDFEFFTTAFPVLMLNPVVASAILPLQKDLFDLIILDEASQLRVEDTYAALFRGKKHVISGDEHQMPPSSYFSSEAVLWDEPEDETAEKDLFLAESASLLEYATDAGYHSTYLDFHYRSRHPDLIAFSNAGFYSSRLVPMPPKQPYQAMHFHAVTAIYSNSTNRDEALAIVEFLYDLAEKRRDKMQGIGVGTLNLRQRDLIQDLLWEQAYADENKSRLLEAMMQAGLFIKNLENIQGDERDIIVIGTTFGPDANGNFRQNFGPLNRQNGYQLLNVLITRAKTDMHVFCSMPENVYLNFEEELRQTGNTGKALLYAYISYVRAVAEQDTNRTEYILNILRENRSGVAGSSRTQKPTLPAFVRATLETRAKDAFSANFKMGGFELEAALKNGKQMIYLQTERPASHPNVHYRELIYRPAILGNYQIETRRIWAYDWWKNADAAASNLLADVNIA